MRHFVVNLVRLCKQIYYDLCLPFDLARLYVCYSLCNGDMSWIVQADLVMLALVKTWDNLSYMVDEYCGQLWFTYVCGWWIKWPVMDVY